MWYHFLELTNFLPINNIANILTNTNHGCNYKPAIS